LKDFEKHRDIIQEQPAAPPLLSSLLAGDQKALPKAVQCHCSMCPGSSNPSERGLPSAFFLLFLCFVFSRFSVFPFFPLSSHFPHLSLENSSGLAETSASFFLGAVILLALRFPSGEKGLLGHTST